MKVVKSLSRGPNPGRVSVYLECEGEGWGVEVREERTDVPSEREFLCGCECKI